MLNKTKLFLQKNKTVLVTSALLVVSTSASAFSTPTAGDTLYTIYDTVNNDLIEGPLGVVAGLALAGYGAYSLVKQAWLPGVISFGTLGVFADLDTTVTTFGASLSVLV